ncbi:MAG: CopL family metal-binding regulatory protein [Caldimonas sp.]
MLRVALCLGVLVNGGAQAIALTHSVSANHQARIAAPPCHEAENRQATESKLHEQNAELPSDKPECCKSGACDCACSHGSAAGVPTVDAAGRGIAHATLVSLAPTRYASPALPRLIRPPIV